MTKGIAWVTGRAPPFFEAPYAFLPQAGNWLIRVTVLYPMCVSSSQYIIPISQTHTP
jgi:hypothetical protein